ncbi:class I SAM-dependent methyltransferase [Jiangella asiatica]|uniref:Class I SAM-dependent methyltransferase n=1 Tax=Jiangella asiatica TaxID=2530372 RepID=A0A4R5DGR1_9ACTN|nr:class I SAM-dependent methyltransferase [Jiangella asiatica]
MSEPGRAGLRCAVHRFCLTGANMRTRLLKTLARINEHHPWSHNDAYAPFVIYHAWRGRRAGAVTGLDVGCGTGRLLRRLARVLPEVTGIEPDPDASKKATASTKDRSNVTVVQSAFPTSEHSRFDFVSMVAVLHHLPLHRGIRAAREVVTPGGRLIIVGCYRDEPRSQRWLELVSLLMNPLIGLVLHPRRASEPPREHDGPRSRADRLIHTDQRGPPRIASRRQGSPRPLLEVHRSLARTAELTQGMRTDLPRSVLDCRRSTGGRVSRISRRRTARRRQAWSGSADTLPCRRPLRTGRADFSAPRLKQAARALRVELPGSCVGVPGGCGGRKRVRGVFVHRPACRFVRDASGRSWRSLDGRCAATIVPTRAGIVGAGRRRGGGHRTVGSGRPAWRAGAG